MNRIVNRRSDIFLANTSITSAKIGWRYCQFVPTVSAQAEKPTPRKLHSYLYSCPIGTFTRAVDYAEAYLMYKIRNMDNIQGMRIAGQAASYVWRRYQRGETYNPVISGMVNSISVYDGNDCSVVGYAGEMFRKQRIYMTEIKDCLEVIASVFAYNRKLIETPDNGYDFIIAFPNPILSPGRPVVVAVFIMRQLMLLSKLEEDIRVVEADEDHAINAAFRGLGLH